MRKLSLSLIIVFLFWSVAYATRGLIISETACADIVSPETGLTWCFDSTNGVMKRWNGSAWVIVTFTSTPIPPNQGGTGIDSSASNGLPSINGGSWLVNTIANGAYIKGGPNNTVTFQTTPIPISDGGTGQGSFGTGYIKNASGVLSAITPIGTVDGGTGQNWNTASGVPTLNAGVAALQTITNGSYFKGGAGNSVTMIAPPIPVGDGGTGQSLTSSGYVKGGSSFTIQATPIPVGDGGTGQSATSSGYVKGGNPFIIQATPIPSTDVSFAPTFTSTDQTIASGPNVTTIAHGLGQKPSFLTLTLKNATPEGGYNAGDEAVLVWSQGGIGCIADATNITIAIAAATLNVPNKSTGAAFSITFANWKAVVRAWK